MFSLHRERESVCVCVCVCVRACRRVDYVEDAGDVHFFIGKLCSRHVEVLMEQCILMQSYLN